MIPAATLTVRDNALGIVPPNTAGIPALVGACSSGTKNTVQSFSDITALRTALGQGPLVELAAYILSLAGGPVRCVRCEDTTAGAAATPVFTGTGYDGVTFTGEPNDAYQVIIEILVGGAVATATFRYSLDNGDTYSPEIATASTYVIPDSGLTVNFAAGTYVVGDITTSACSERGCTSSDLNTGLDALIASELDYGFVVVVGLAADVSGAATIAGAVKTKIEGAATTHNRYLFALMECPDDTDSNIISGFSAVDSTRLAVGAGFCELTSVISGRTYKRGAMWPIAARLASSDIHVDPGRVKDGALPGVSYLYRDERKLDALDSEGFMTLRSWVGRSGYYATSGAMKTASTSDYSNVTRRRVMDRASTVAYPALQLYVLDTVRVDATAGYIDERDAIAIERTLTAALEAAVVSPGSASSASATTKRDENILTTQNLTASLRVVPLGLVRAITADIGFENPALSPS